nr:phage tail tube protein [uncultured Mediterranean phage uvMED]|tara:strand:+ start:358 stop:951 length:594 start_codon:yes stop_codon:yes gene_type:complete
MAETNNLFKKQIQNRNFLSPLGYKLVLTRAPKVAFFANSANIPGIELGTTEQPNYLRKIPVPGDMMVFEDLTLRFMIDENLENYMELQNWMRGLGFPESLNEIYNLQKQEEFAKLYPDVFKTEMNLYSDATLFVLTNSESNNFKVNFKGLFPYSLTSIQFDSTPEDIQYVRAEVKFKYMMYNIVDRHDKPLHPLNVL